MLPAAEKEIIDHGLRRNPPQNSIKEVTQIPRGIIFGI